MSFFTLFSSLGLVCLLVEAQKLVMTEPGPSFINAQAHVITSSLGLVCFLVRNTKACYD